MIKSLIQSLVTKVVVAAINFFVLVISSKYLGVSSRGEISIFLLNVSIVQIVSGIYTGYGIVHFVPKFNLRALLKYGIIFTIVLSILSNAIIVLFNKQVPGYEYFGLLASLLVIFNTFLCLILLGRENIKMFNVLSVLQPLTLLLGIIVFTFGFGIYTFSAYFFPLLFSFTIALLVSSPSVFGYPLHETNQKPFNVKQILSDGIVFQTGLLMYIFCNRFSYYLLPNKASVGLYSLAVTLAESVLIIANGIAPVLMARVANQTDKNKNVEISLSLSKLSFVLSLLGILIILSIPETFFINILGKGFAGIKSLILAYAPGVLAISAFIPLTNYFSASGRQKTILTAYGIGLFVTLLAAPLLVTRYGTHGAAVAAILSYFSIGAFLVLVFVTGNKIPLRRCLSFKQDFNNITQLFMKSKPV